jgi:hypothetical protein
MQEELTELLNQIRLFENLKECYQVRIFYIESNSAGLSESEMNEVKLNKLLSAKEVETISIKLAQLHRQYDNLHYKMIEQKTNSSMQNDESRNAAD